MGKSWQFLNGDPHKPDFDDQDPGGAQRRGGPPPLAFSHDGLICIMIVYDRLLMAEMYLIAANSICSGVPPSPATH